jgi:hypothetical protein
MNGYSTTRIPEGWDRWFAGSERATKQSFNDQGTLVSYDPSKHLYEDVLRGKALAWLRNRDRSSPFLAVLATHAPHTPAIPAPRHATLFPNARLPKPPSFNEKYVSDKNGWIRNLPPASSTRVDDMERPIGALRAMRSLLGARGTAIVIFPTPHSRPTDAPTPAPGSGTYRPVDLPIDPPRAFPPMKPAKIPATVVNTVSRIWM